MATPDSNQPHDKPAELQLVADEGFNQVLAELGCSVATTTYRSGRLLTLRSGGARVSVEHRALTMPMGMAVRYENRTASELTIGTQTTVWRFHRCDDIARQVQHPSGITHDAGFLPMSAHRTGDIRIHELVHVNPESMISGDDAESPGPKSFGAEPLGSESLGPVPSLRFINTRFSCVCRLDERYSFVPVWRPPFLKTFAADDACHLSGLGVEDGVIRYATAHGRTAEPEGWRANKTTGGVILNVPHGEAMASGLCMPHSPRVYAGRLFVLNSGLGELNVVDRKTGSLDTVIRLPGFTRGLAFAGKYAFVGLSMIREKKDFGGLPIEQLGEGLTCGVAIVDLTAGKMVGLAKFTGVVTELFDVQVLPFRFPLIFGPESKDAAGAFLVP